MDKEPIRDIPKVSWTPGERAGVRKINMEDRKDIRRLLEIDQKNAGVVNVGGAAESKKEIYDWLKGIRETPGQHVYAVTGQHDAKGKSLPKKQRWEIEGWIRTDTTDEERERYKNTTEEDTPADVPITEVASIKRIDPSMPQGLMSSARRQILLAMLKEDMENKLYSEDEAGVIKPKRIVMAYVANKNTNREDVVRSLLASGFVSKKQNVEYEEGDAEDICELFVLDWEKLQEIEEKKTEAAILEKLAAKRGKGAKPELYKTTPGDSEQQEIELAAIRQRIQEEQKKKEKEVLLKKQAQHEQST